jgi:tRNA threonylcarbamoyladenosine biosynthesis protein TsaB
MTTPDPTTVPRKVLALDTSTDRLSVALGDGDQRVQHFEGPGGAQASATLIPTILQLLAAQGWALADLDAIAFGCGPGSFTGLRTSCAVVQGLAVAARPGGVPVVPIHTLLAVAEEARWQWAQNQLPHLPASPPAPQRQVSVLDARMDELYVAEVHLGPQGRQLQGSAWLSAPEALSLGDGWPQANSEAPVPWLVGNAMAVYGARLPAAWQTCPQIAAWPSASALLRLVPGLWTQGAAVAAAEAQPLYVRDKVAQTTAEREAIKARQLAAAAGSAA